MAVKIRLRRMGAKKQPFYRVVVADSRCARNGRFIEQLGYYDPRSEPLNLKLDEEKILLWLGRGAQPTETAAALLKKGGLMDKFLASKEKTAAPSAVAEEEVESEVTEEQAIEEQAEEE